ncbi:MAG: hypothetical protein ABIS07_05490, partial [Dokdonella sp.]
MSCALHRLTLAVLLILLFTAIPALAATDGIDGRAAGSHRAAIAPRAGGPTVTDKAGTPRRDVAVTPSPNDQVIADDLIVQGSTCIGFDCVVDESFGFDTIRLKENNTRIVFFDTSVAGFPNHHWQLTANDSDSGGLEKFSIEDLTAATVPFTVLGSAPSDALFVASNGKVGMR